MRDFAGYWRRDAGHDQWHQCSGGAYLIFSQHDTSKACCVPKLVMIETLTESNETQVTVKLHDGSRAKLPVI